MKTFRKSLVYFLFFIPHFIHAQNEPAQKKLNILFISIDDMGINYDAYGNVYAPCPNMARLASHGVMFKRAYLSYPLCSPSRTCVMSGYRTDKNGITDNDQSIRTFLGPRFRFINEYFNDRGYYTVKYGKYTCEHENQVSWDRKANTGVEPTYPGLQQKPVWWIDTIPKSEDETHNADVITPVINDIKTPRKSPYFYGIGLSSHNPFTPTLYEWNLVGDKNTSALLPVDQNGTKTNVYGNGSGNLPLPYYPPDDTLDIPKIAEKDFYFFTPEEQQNIRHAYFAEMAGVDIQIGRLLDELDSLHSWDSTIVVFYSDNGLHMGEHLGVWLKSTLFNESLRIPFIICAPGIKPGVCNELVELADIFPTLDELCGLTLYPDFEGTSLVPLMQKPDALWKSAVFSDIKKNAGAGDTLMGRAVNTKSFHYNSWQTKGEELYDVIHDSMEITNIAGNPAYADTLNKMRTILAAGWAGAKPPVYTRNTFFRDNDNDGYGRNTDSITAYFAPDGYALQKGDCNDDNDKIHPGAVEYICNGIDDNCNNATDESRPVPVITPQGDLNICVTGSVILKADKGTGLFYQWYRDGVQIPGATKVSLKATSTGSYTVEVKIQSGCNNFSQAAVVYSSCLSVAKNNSALQNTSANLSVYPSPSAGKIIVQYKSNKDENIIIHVYNADGRLVSSLIKQSNTCINKFDLDLSHLPSGLYTLDINNQQPVKFLIEK